MDLITPAIDLRIAALNPQYAIINSAHGLWGQIDGNNVLQNIEPYRTANIKVISYITSGYEGKGSAGKLDAKWYTRR